ncbi:MAG TPA: phosphodiesterase [Solirubrobacteraceae bacterium]
MTVLLAQISDLHVGVDDDRAAENAARAVEAVASWAPDAVLVSGDLASGPAEGEYERVRELLAPLSMPVHLLPGNHDDPDGMRAVLGAPGEPGTPLQYAADVGPLRLVVADTTLRGRGDGALGAERLAWLDATLAEQRDRPTLLAMHHPPLLLGNPAMDEFRLAPEDRAAVARLLERHRHVIRVLCGHMHRNAYGVLAGVPVFFSPATSIQLKLDFQATELTFSDEPPGFALHRLADGELITHVVAVG